MYNADSTRERRRRGYSLRPVRLFSPAVLLLAAGVSHQLFSAGLVISLKNKFKRSKTHVGSISIGFLWIPDMHPSNDMRCDAMRSPISDVRVQCRFPAMLSSSAGAPCQYHNIIVIIYPQE
jgi:hypothetical protein